MSKTAIYLVDTPSGKRLIEASNKQVAINFAVRSSVTAEPIKATDLMRYLNEKMTVEVATEAKPAKPTPHTLPLQDPNDDVGTGE